MNHEKHLGTIRKLKIGDRVEFIDDEHNTVRGRVTHACDAHVAITWDDGVVSTLTEDILNAIEIRIRTEA